MSNRKAERKVKGEWKPIEMEKIKKGNIIRMFEEDGTIDRSTELGIKATSDASLDGAGNWSFQADMMYGANQKKKKEK